MLPCVVEGDGSPGHLKVGEELEEEHKQHLSCIGRMGREQLPTSVNWVSLKYTK